MGVQRSAPYTAEASIPRCKFQQARITAGISEALEIRGWTQVHAFPRERPHGKKEANRSERASNRKFPNSVTVAGRQTVSSPRSPPIPPSPCELPSVSACRIPSLCSLSTSSSRKLSICVSISELFGFNPFQFSDFSHIEDPRAPHDCQSPCRLASAGPTGVILASWEAAFSTTIAYLLFWVGLCLPRRDAEALASSACCVTLFGCDELR